MKTYSCATTDPSDASRGRGLFWIPVINEHPLVWERGGRRECVANPCNKSALTGLISTFRNGNGIPFIEAGQGVDHFYFTPRTGQHSDIRPYYGAQEADSFSSCADAVAGE
ncbi:hypothetical protein AB1Y20_013586 [Prymnesium parvum]|uniref:Uncharacterized protein n=1 Tax=Prymnesium parvum TaxID=97485 RepID=A0AB34IHQ1_PRYPA